MKNTICDEDCFNCKFPDCKLPDYMCREHVSILSDGLRRQIRLERNRVIGAEIRARKKEEERCQPRVNGHA